MKYDSCVFILLGLDVKSKPKNQHLYLKVQIE